MAIKFKKGNIVKYKDRYGNKSGGTIVDIIQENGEKYALINSVDGINIKKRVSDLSLIQRQKRGRVSSKFMEDFKDELETENMGNTQDEIVEDKPVDILPFEVESNNNENTTSGDDGTTDNIDSLKCEIESLKQIIAKQTQEIDDKNEELVSLRHRIRTIVEENNSTNEELKRKLAMEEHKRKEAEKRLQDSVKGVHTTSLTINQNVDNSSLERMKTSLSGMADAIQAFAIKSEVDAVNRLVETIMKLNGL